MTCIFIYSKACPSEQRKSQKLKIRFVQKDVNMAFQGVRNYLTFAFGAGVLICGPQFGVGEIIWGLIFLACH